MKDVKRELKKVAVELKRAAKDVEKLAGKLATPTKAKPVKKAVGKKLSGKGAKKITAADKVFAIINRSRKGVNMSSIKQKTGYDDKKVQNIIYKLKKQGKIKSETKGVYVTS